VIDTDELDKKTLREKWEVLTEYSTCPYPLRSFVGSRLIDLVEPESDPRTTTLLVELKPGVAFSSVTPLTDSLASFLNMASGNVWIEDSGVSARRVEITIVRPADEA
jgi:hypothetical protein